MECSQLECSSRSSCDDTERGADAAEAIQAPRPQDVHLSLAPRRCHVTMTDLRKYGVTIGCVACSDIAVQEKTAKYHPEQFRTRIGEQMEHDPEGDERLQVHKRRRDAELEVEANRAPVARENEGYPKPQERQDVEMSVEVSGASASKKLGSHVVADDEERARLRLGTEGKRGQKHDMQDVLEPQFKTKARLDPRRGQKRA